MATRRRGGADLDDLRARLGLSDDKPAVPSDDDGGEAAAAPADTDAPDDDAVDAAPPAAAHAAAPAPAPVAAAPAPAPARSSVDDDPFLGEDYTSAVSDAESGSYDYDPHAHDPSVKAPRSGMNVGLIIAVVVCLGLGLALGIGFTAGNTARSLHNAISADAGRMLADVEPIARELATLSGTLAGISAETQFSEDFQAELRAAYGETPPVLEGSTLASAAKLMAFDADLSRQLLAYSMSTQFLAELVDTHLRKTERDADEIAREIANVTDDRAIGIAFPMADQLAAYNAHVQDNAAYQPIGGERVAITSLAIQTRGEGDDMVEFYEVESSSGQTIQVPISDLVLIPREQLLPAITNETPVARYRARAAQIKEVVAEVAQQQDGLVERLREVSSRPDQFTF